MKVLFFQILVYFKLSNSTEEQTTDVSLSGVLSNMDNITEMVRVLKDQFVQVKLYYLEFIELKCFFNITVKFYTLDRQDG